MHGHDSLPAFELVVLDDTGAVRTVSRRAADEEDARRSAERDGHEVLECRSARRQARLFARTPKVDAIAFAQDLATLLEAGVSINHGVTTLARRAPSGAYRQVLERLTAYIGEGVALSDAMQRTQAFSSLLVATVSASEQTGDVSVGLSRFAGHQQELRALRDRIIGACVYPLLLLVVGTVVLLVLLGVVVPRFSQVLDVQSRQLPALSRLLMLWGRFVMAHPSTPFVMLVAVACAVLLITAQWTNPARRRAWLARLPGASRLAEEFQQLQMYRTAAILTSRGVPIQKALGYTLDYLNPTSQHRLEHGLAAMQEGLSLSSALAASGLVDQIASSMLSVAEHSGSLPEILDRIADFYERSLRRNVEIASRLIEPILMIVFGVLIGGIVLLMYLPIFDLASNIT